MSLGVDFHMDFALFSLLVGCWMWEGGLAENQARGRKVVCVCVKLCVCGCVCASACTCAPAMKAFSCA